MSMSRKILPLCTAKRLASLWLIFAAAFAFAATDNANDAPRAEGTWQGTLELRGQRLRLIAHIHRGPDGLTGTLDSIDQRATGLPLDAVTLTEDVLSFQITQIGARYAGNFYGDDTIRGVWSQGPDSLPLILRRDGRDEAFQTARAASIAEYEKLEETFNPAALRIIGDWVLERARAHR
jgi:hypothetical protein